jgi:lysophospholipase L1-like esterase
LTPKAKFILVGGGIFISCLIVVLFLFELYLRLTETQVVREKSGRGLSLVESDAEFLVNYTPRGRRLVPNARVLIRNHRISGRDILMEINSLGFRDEEISREKQDDEFRILVLGDSITWASYLRAEETYVERTEEYLKEALPARRVEVINAGVGDIGLREEVDLLREKGLSVEPDVVVVSFYLNDSRPPWGFPGELGSRGWLRRHSLLAETIYKNLKLRKWIKEQGEVRLGWTSEMNKMNWQDDRAAFLRLARRARYDWGAAWEADSWKVIEVAFRPARFRGGSAGFPGSLPGLRRVRRGHAPADPGGEGLPLRLSLPGLASFSQKLQEKREQSLLRLVPPERKGERFHRPAPGGVFNRGFDR